MNISAALGVAVREFPLKTGAADYMLYADGKAIGVVEAKPEGHTLTSVEIQSAKYTTGLPDILPHYHRPLPFLLAAHDYVTHHHGRDLDPDQKKHLRQAFARGWELVPATARLCIMNVFLHGINAAPCPVTSGLDSLAGDPGERFSMVLTNPPFGKKSSISIVTEEGQLEKADHSYERQDF